MEDIYPILRDKILSQQYTPEPPFLFHLYDTYRRKDRAIEAPKPIDAIVQRFLWNLVNPHIESMYISNSFCGITKKGTEVCKTQFLNTIKSLDPESFYIQFDIHHYYASIDHSILQTQLSHLLAPEYVRLMLTPITGKTKGIGIGHLLSQLFGNYHLNDFDHWMTSTFYEFTYMRYADDFVLIGVPRKAVYAIEKKVRNYLETNLNLTIKQPHSAPIYEGGDFVGCKYTYDRKTGTFNRTLRRPVILSMLRAIGKGNIDAVVSYLSMAEVTSSYGYLRAQVPSNMVKALPKRFQ